ncbi:PIN domain-like protein [Mycena rebaudengoi]|nr:PIN domain-like protein [Mycena rebaudengoi]
MGIPGLWKELEPIEQKISLHNLAVTGFTSNATAARGFRVGIDASGWMCRACARHGCTESPELVALFSRCSRLFRLPFIPVFVFDGPDRPNMKRGKHVRGDDHWLAADFREMLNGFGFEWIVARGEAEATLSNMTTNGIPLRVDAILTDDSDSFVFGASLVLRIRSEDNENYQASRYSAFDISKVLGLSREDMVFIAILAGGDYSDGLDQCGITTAIGLARAGLGRQLISGFAGKSQSDSLLFLQTWRESLSLELSTNSSGHLPHRYHRLATNIPSEFPDLAVIDLYLHPLVSAIPDVRSLVFCPPQLSLLARFAEDHFQWGNSVEILSHFSDLLFAGLVIRELTGRALAVDNLEPPTKSPSIIKKIVGDRRHATTGFLAELRLVLSVDPTTLTSALQAISGRRDPEQGAQQEVATWITTRLPKVRVWVPRSMVEHVYPALILDYICTNAPKSKKRKNTNTRPNISPSSSSRPVITLTNQCHRMNHAASMQGSSSSRHVNSSSTRREKRYSAMSVTYQGQEVVELITDSEGEY